MHSYILEIFITSLTINTIKLRKKNYLNKENNFIPKSLNF